MPVFGLILVAIVLTTACLLVGSLIHSWWKLRDWRKIRRGETKRGFRLWMERQCCTKKSEEERHYNLLKTPLSTDDNLNEWIKRETTSVFMTINHQFELTLRRCSLFAPSVYTDIARVIYPAGEGYLWVFDLQMDDRTIASTFQNMRSGRNCVVFIDIKHRTYRLLNVPPIHLFQGGRISILYMRRGDGERPNRLRIVYARSQWFQREIISVDYEMRPSKKNPSRLFAVEIDSPGWSIVPGRRAWAGSSIPGVYFVRANFLSASSFAYVITINQRGEFRVQQYDEWDKVVMATDYERRSRKAISDFKAMFPPEFKATFPFEWREKCCFYRFQNYILGQVGDTIVKCQIYPPSMMQVAAEAACQAKPPDVDPSLIKFEIGVDIFDGIIEDQEKPVPTICVPSEDELIQDD